MTEGRHSCMRDEPGRSPGCPDREDWQPGGTGWVCTDHFTWMGETLHVACSADRAVGAWFDEDRSWVERSATRRIRTIDELRKVLVEEPRFVPEVTEQEIEAAATALQRLIGEMSR